MLYYKCTTTMAQLNDNIVMKNMSGAIGKQLVFRRVNGKTIACKYPNRSHVQKLFPGCLVFLCQKQGFILHQCCQAFGSSTLINIFRL
jgi:hypothetical protein